MGACKCNGVVLNTGTPNCDALADIAQRHIMVPLVDGTGARNKIDPSVAINAAFITARLNDLDATKRWYPMPLMKNITDERADSIVEEFEDGSKFKIRQGTRAFNGLLVNFGPNYFGQLAEFSCVDTGVYEVDASGNLIGSLEEDGFLYPIPIEKGSWDPKLVKKTDTTVGKIMISFDYAQSMRDENLALILNTDITGVDLLTINGLLDVHLVLVTTPPTTTGFTAKFKTNFGDVINPLLVKGLLISDFYEETLTTGSRIWNVTDDAAVTLTSVTETPANSGSYDFVYPAQTVGDVLRLYPKKNGYDFSEIYDGDHDLPAIV